MQERNATIVSKPHLNSMDQIAQVREKIDIVVLIADYIPLKKMGSNFKANCPFHSEKTPSFVVSPQRQIWHCFGCQKGGDCYTFLIEYEHLEFAEALRILAKKVGVSLEGFRYSTETLSKKEHLYALNHLASEFYHYILVNHAAGESARQYLVEKRHVTLALMKTFILGYAPSSGNSLANYLLKKKKYKKEDVLESGLVIDRRGQLIDFFINRIMFPLSDHRGNIVGFSGRLLDNAAQSGPKYINTKDTLVYHKGELFFALDKAKDSIKKTGKVIIMEGEFDVISAYKNGITNTVAIKGTALTAYQVNLIARFAQKVSLCLDKDSAGQEALKRSLLLLEKKGLTTTVVDTQDAKDPDEALAHDAIAFKKAVEHDIGIYDYILNQLMKKYDSTSAEGKKKVSDELLPLLVNIDNEIIKEHYLKKLSLQLDTSYESIMRQVEKLTKKDLQTALVTQTKKKKSRREVLEEYLVSLILQHKDIKNMLNIVTLFQKEYIFEVSAYQRLLEYLFTYMEEKTQFDPNTFAQLLPTELLQVYDSSLLRPGIDLSDQEYKKEFQKSMQELKTLHIREQIKKLSERIQLKEKNSEASELETLQIQLAELLKSLDKQSKITG